MLACRMASLCISWSLQAGIMSLRTPNSSFIFERRRRSMRLWAVFRAIFLPAALVDVGCFLPFGVEVPEPFVVVGGMMGEGLARPGFIWMILRDLVGGGGREKLLFIFSTSGCFILKVRLRLEVGVLSTGEDGEAG